MARSSVTGLRASSRSARPLVLAMAIWMWPVGSAPAANLPDWISAREQARLLVVTLDAGVGDENGGLNYNRLFEGSRRIVVPVGWTVIVRMRNADARVPHSTLVTRVYRQEEMPDRLGPNDAAFPGASTPVPFTGTAGGGYGEFAFSANKAGHYFLACGVHTHLQAGMWLRLDVVENISQPDFRTD